VTQGGEIETGLKVPFPYMGGPTTIAMARVGVELPEGAR
jgi:hypothetical protein